jgi:diacylglycerol kinase (ATP)
MAKTGNTGLVRIIKAFNFAWKGLKSAFKTEAAFRQESLAVAIAIPVALFMHIPAASKAILIGSVMLVLIIECVNTAIEALADRISDEHHKLLGKAKDCGSAAVFLAIVNAVIVWLVIILN